MHFHFHSIVFQTSLHPHKYSHPKQWAYALRIPIKNWWLEFRVVEMRIPGIGIGGCPQATATFRPFMTTKCVKTRSLRSMRTNNSDPSLAVQETATATATDASTQPPAELNLEATIVCSISSIGQNSWDSCHDGSNPFLSYDFLLALEESGSVAPDCGWLPQHFCIHNLPTNGPESDKELMACVPLYLKSHSAGEYVFDHAWAQSYDSNFVSPMSERGYYPKLQSCIPFTPVTGSRMLLRPGEHAEEVAGAVAGTLAKLPGDFKLSSLHVTFNTAEECNLMARVGGLKRMGVQYHWHNDSGPTHDGRPRSSSSGNGSTDAVVKYTSFDDFLAALQQKRRKAIRQERKKVSNAGLVVERLSGTEVQDSDLWDSFYRFYLNTIDRKWGTAYLTREFFDLLSERMADKVLLVTAREQNSTGGPAALPAVSGAAGRGGQRRRPIAAALNLLGTDAIYGRNWGCEAGDEIKGLHFELCFYQAIEHAITHGFDRVEAGAQGEHKLARGYLPELTYSSHFIQNYEFRGAVEAFLRRERAEMGYVKEMMRQQESPYKSHE